MKICPEHKEKMYSITTKHGLLFICPVKGCDVLCWDGDTSTPAGERVRMLRKQTHSLFDSLWKTDPGICGSRSRARKRAYRWLRNTMGLEAKDCHIGMFDLAKCNRAIDALKAREGTL